MEALSPKLEKHGIEINPEAVDYAQRNQNEFGDNILCVALEEAPCENGSFGMIAMCGTIEHLPDPVSTVKKVSQLLRMGGYYYITATPNGDSFAADLLRNKWMLFHRVQHIWHFSPRTLGLICSSFGLSLSPKIFRISARLTRMFARTLRRLP